MKTVFSSKLTLDDLNSSNAKTFGETIGFRYTEMGPDFVRATFTVDERHTRPGGIMNGGVSLGVIESVGSAAARFAVYDQNRNTLGIQVSANHLRVARVGDKLTATAKVKHLGRSMHLWEIVIENQDAKVVSIGQLTMMVVDALP